MRHEAVIGVVFLSGWLGGQAYAQTAVDLRTQSKNVDFSGASATKPSKTGAALPAGCSVGETFFLTSAAAGQNLYFCTAADEWSLQGQSPAPVTSVMGRTGAVTGQAGDYAFDQIAGSVGNAQIGVGIDAAKIGVGAVSNAVFGYLANVRGDLQSQLDSKAAGSHSHPGGGDLSGEVGASTVVGLQNRRVAGTVPSDQQALVWNAATTAWEPRTITAGGGGGGAAQLGDLAAARSSETVLSIGSLCSQATPCSVRFGSQVFRITSEARATITSGSGTAYIYVTPAGSLTVGHTVGGLTCSGCTGQAGISAFPPNALPLYSWTASNGTWDAGGGSDQRAFLSTKTLTASTGITLTEAGGETAVAVNAAVVGTFSSGTGAAPATCTVGESYVKTDTAQVYQCTAANRFTEVTGGGGAAGPGTMVEERYYAAASYDGIAASARSAVVTPQSSGAGAEAAGVAPWKFVYLKFDPSGARYAIFPHRLPSSWTGAGPVGATLHWSQNGGGTTGNVVWSVQAACLAGGANISSDPVWNAAQNVTVAEPAQGVLVETGFSPEVTGCAPGSVLHVRVARLGDDPGDTGTRTATLIGMTVRHERSLP